MAKNINYIPEICLNSELQLFNNSKKLKNDESLFFNYHLPEIEKLREEYTILDYSDDKGLQAKKKEIRDKIRTMSDVTFVNRDPDIFGEMILLVINKLGTSHRFNGYNYIDEMKSLAVNHILSYSHGFNAFKQSDITNQYVSAFAYITSAAFNAFVATINSHKKAEKLAKDEFVETQKLFHRDPNISTFNPSHSEIEDVIHINKITDSLLDEIKKIPIVETDIKILYPKDYKISMDEFNAISEYTKENKMTLSYVRDIPPEIEETENV